MSEETKTVGDVLEDFVRGKPKWEAISRAYHSIFDNLDPDKRARLEEMQAYYRSVASAYTEIRIGDSDAARLIYKVGSYARGALWQFYRITQLYDTDIYGTIDLLQKTSDWLIAKGWVGLPKVESDGLSIRKTAKETRDDMLKYAKLMSDLDAADRQAEANDDSLKHRVVMKKLEV